jgi:DNA-binding MarR family transcriptional regulator
MYTAEIRRDTSTAEILPAGHLRKIVDWAIATKAAALAEEGLTNHQYELLQQVIRGSDMKSLTQHSHYYQSSLTRVFNVLEGLHLVSRSKAGLRDRRQVAIAPTKAGEECQNRVEAVINDRLSKLFLKLPKSKQGQAAEAMKAIADLIGPSKYDQFSFGKPTGPSF